MSRRLAVGGTHRRVQPYSVCVGCRFGSAPSDTTGQPNWVVSTSMPAAACSACCRGLCVTGSRHCLFGWLRPVIFTLLSVCGVSFLVLIISRCVDRLTPLYLAIMLLYVANSRAESNRVTTIVSVMVTSGCCGMYEQCASRCELGAGSVRVRLVCIPRERWRAYMRCAQ